ncbi:hypothetical protein GIB67_004476 [Kingdonia uniflora]|uniref:Uncharacterized protein n=1 Tax=Kingdonia uniflora TaxID=39325 RepID=A0A7J7MS69_9MAGN|nr:hypothetical protein GIB67_004476 [Kingdonia uniflora]
MGKLHMKEETNRENENSFEEDDEKYDKSTKPAGSFLMIFRYWDTKDKLLMILGTIGCIADGSSTPLIMLVLSKMMNKFAQESSFSLTEIDRDSLTLVYVALGVGLGAFLEGLCWARTAERQTSRLRRKYLRAVLRQDAGFLDTRQGTSTRYQVVSSISNDTITIQGVLSEKIPNFLMNTAVFISSQAVALYLSWKLAVIAIPALSLLIIPGIIYGKLLAGIGAEIQEAYGVAGGIAENAFSSIRTVFSYVGEHQTEVKFSAALERGLEHGIKQGLVKGWAIGSVGVAFAVWAFQAWYGSILVIHHGARGGDVFTAGVCIVVGGLALGSSLVNVKYFAEASTAASLIFEMIDRVPSIDPDGQQGKTMKIVRGELEFKDIDFAYPSRPESIVLKKFSLRVIPSQTVGLVGGSGSGKSTVVSLLERFYDPLGGKVLLDSTDIKTLQLKWLRCQIGLVSQEPILFATSIKENILFGKEGASMDEVINASKAANAHKFIVQLPDGYDTQVGQFGVQMSGGQKQRIAIARALVKDPRILLLDEATSALDSKSEKAVQDALDQASVGRTTIIVAHRLSTLRNADLIAVLQSGQVVESGSHDELIQNKHGQYSAMVQLQQKTSNPSLKPESDTNISSAIDSETDNNTEVTSNKIISYQFSPNDANEDNFSTPSLWSLVKMASPEWNRGLLGCAAAFCFGAIQPFHSFCMGALLSAYYLNDEKKIRLETKLYCFVFLLYAFSTLITNVIQHYNFGVVGEHLTKRVREKMLAKIMTFEIEWFDQEDNTSGALCSRLAREATLVRSLVCDRLALLAQVFSAAIIAVTLALILAWKLAILIIALQPLIIGSFYARGVLMKSMSMKVLQAQSNSSKLASEAIANHRNIAAFSVEEKIMGLFEVTLEGPKRESQKQSWYAGLGLFISQFLTAANAGLILWYGGTQLFHGTITYKHLFQTFFILVTTGRVIAEAGTMTSDLSKGTDAIKSVFSILERSSKMDSDDPNGLKPEKINGEIELKEVDFCYPSRPKQMIFVGLSLKVQPMTIVALVGQSGSGKSTIIGLIQRFYDPLRGLIQIDGVDIKSYNLRALSSMKKGYGTYCGEQGVQLSGGQKQRIALARAILKNPAILVLDEATSALDSRSESLVQDAMEKMMLGRTCVVVAHHLSTIKKADLIAVIDSGKVAEEGSHNQLLAKGEGGLYYSLHRLQEGEK